MINLSKMLSILVMFLCGYGLCVEGKVVGQGEDEREDHAWQGKVQAGASESAAERDEGVHHGHVPLHREGDGHVDRHHHCSLTEEHLDSLAATFAYLSQW